MTITLEEDMARWARIQAAMENTSVSRYLGEILKEEMRRDQSYEKAMTSYLSRNPRRISKSGTYPKRDALHDRKNLR